MGSHSWCTILQQHSRLLDRSRQTFSPAMEVEPPCRCSKLTSGTALGDASEQQMTPSLRPAMVNAARLSPRLAKLMPRGSSKPRFQHKPQSGLFFQICASTDCTPNSKQRSSVWHLDLGDSLGSWPAQASQDIPQDSARESGGIYARIIAFNSDMVVTVIFIPVTEPPP